jgi:hypothetical protein
MPISAALGSSALLPAGLGFRNKLINGDFRINQRGGASYTGTSTIQYTLDRWWTYTTSGTVTFSQSTSVVPPGFSSSLAVSVTTGGTYSTGGNYCLLGQSIEAGNLTDLCWGTANAKPVTLSFWVRSSISGVYGVSLQNYGYQTQAYVATYTIDATNTWEYKTIQIPGSTTGTWNGNTNNSFTSGGVFIGFSLGVDTNFQAATANAWGSSAAYGTAATVDLAATTGATFYLTGIQLEQNYQPTPFEQRPYQVELELCQRYFYRYSVPSGNGSAFGYLAGFSSTRAFGTIQIPVQMRGSISITPSGTQVDSLALNFVGNVTAISVYPTQGNAISGPTLLADCTTTNTVAGTLYHLRVPGGASISFSSEL